MTKVLEEAIKKVRELPEERQAYAAVVLEQIAAQGDGMYHLTDEERREVRAGLAEIERGEIATDEEMDALWKRTGVRSA